MTPRSNRPPRRLRTFLLIALLAVVAASLPGASAGATPAHGADRPTIVLVHGAFADASSWEEVTRKLQNRGLTVYAPAVPLRGLTADSDHLRSFLATLSGPIVLVGHSYGGAVITNAATGNPDVRGLVYVAGYAPAEGEVVGALNDLGGHPEESLLLANLVNRDFPGGTDAYVDPAHFREVMAADVTARTAAVLAAGQRPVSLAAFGEPSGVPAWATIPSWYLVASRDRAIPPSAERAMAARAGSTTVEIRSSHLAMVGHSGEVTQLILAAIRG
ncbi:alpha/beta fold hydrolase [Modestobacter sp. VKM Ac-2985]|uniref:alpha/beta fold hydrolase n=1 Tax=Modestobacter sp. VKM Ac-2985 TaxID=3004139 RepID=UPI0022ABA1E5|nr:alpha/beta hydrolase [Modestobacter sp. VKM Ac-2985]MCZ2839616.1 alpha/beta hydrolase [Modestobacter sp. VKM Ac-2985]